MAKHRVAALADVPPGCATLVAAGGIPLCLARTDDGSVYAVSDVCTHEGSSLSEGTLEDFEIECPTHLSRFDLRTGEVTSPPATESVASYPTEIVDGDVYVDV